MKVIIAGSRDITDVSLVQIAVDESGFDVTEVICGMARGVDTLGKEWADAKGIPVIKRPANWSRYRKEAGRIRNTEMAMEGEALIAIMDSKGTPGTSHMIRVARGYGLKVHVHIRRLRKP